MKANGGIAKKAAGPLIKDVTATAATNLNVLKRTDPDVEEVLGTAGHVCLYGFDVETKHRKEVEGSMFVVKRRTAPRFQFIIMNRLNMENLVQDVLGDFEFELSPPYLLYRTGNEVNGLWFYQQEECDQMTVLLNRISGAFVKNAAATAAGAAPAAPTEAPPVVVLRAPSQAPAAAGAAPAPAQRASRAAAAPMPAAPRSSPPAPDAAGAVSKAPLLTPEMLKQRAATDAAANAQPPAAPPPLSATPAPPAHVAAPAPAVAAPAATAASAAAPTGEITRSRIRDAMLRVVMTDAFLDMMHAELNKPAS